MGEDTALKSQSEVLKYKNQDFEKILTHCSQCSVLWEDPVFMPDIGDLTWKRPWEIAASPCLFQEGKTIHDVREGLLNNGYLVVAMQALSARPELLNWVVPKDERVFQAKLLSGVAHFKIWQFGIWYDICVDDRLPTKDGKLAYTHSNDTDEFWCALLEKACAKLCGSYKALENGHSTDAMVDFSGGLCEIISLNPPPSKFGKLFHSAFKKHLLICAEINKEDHNLSNSLKCQTDDHDYTITQVKYSQHIVVIRVKDPRGVHKWTSIWSDPSSTWKLTHDETKQGLNLDVNSEGEFWMQESEFKDHFSSLSICHLSPDTFMNIDNRLESSKNWCTNFVNGNWVKGISAGGKNLANIHQNHQYRITLTDPDDGDEGGLCSMIISLLQKNKTRQQSWKIGLKVFKLDSFISPSQPLGLDFFTTNPNNLGTRFHINRREVVFRQRFLPGVYCIIPCTANQDEEGDFLLRVFTGKEVVVEKFDRKISIKDVQDIVTDLVENRVVPVTEESKTEEDVIKLFIEVAGKDLTVDWSGLKIILDVQEGNINDYSFFPKYFYLALDKITFLFNFFLPISKPESQKSKASKQIFSKDLCRALISFIDVENSGKIGFDEFEQLWSQIGHWRLLFQLHSNRTKNYIEADNLRGALEKAGFVLSKRILGILIHRYADDEGRLSFDDFIMSIVTLKLELSNFNNLDKKDDEQVVLTLNEWVEKSILY